MRLSVLHAGYAQPHISWLAIDELADLLVHYFDAERLSPNRAKPGWRERLIGRGPARWDPVQTRGGDMLIVVAHDPQQLSMIEAVPQLRQRFARIHAWVTDSYFQSGFGRATASFDSITVTAFEDAPYVRERFGIAVHPLYQGADCLTWVPRQAHARSIDLIGFGRVPPSIHEGLVKTLHTADAAPLYLHSPLGHLSGPVVRPERAMLFKLLQRSGISLAFHLHMEPQGQRPRSMMVTSRWLESLLSGCIVAGRRPLSRMADEMLNWAGATIELPETSEDAVARLIELTQAREDMEWQRCTNMREMLLRHDWRHRIMSLCQLWGLPVPAQLRADIERVHELAAALA